MYKFGKFPNFFEKKIIDSKRITIYRKMEALIQQIKFSIIFELNSAINKYYANGII